MKATMLFSCSLTMVFLPSVTSDPCKMYNLSSNLQHFVHEGEPFTISCLLGDKLNLEFPERHLTWYRTSNDTPVSKDQHSRVQQREDSIWFLPAILRDSGSYACIIRNATHCSKGYFYLTVFSKSNGSCFSGNFATSQEVFTSRNAKIVCPSLDSFRAETHLLPMLWYKVHPEMNLEGENYIHAGNMVFKSQIDCKLIKDKRFQKSSNYILLHNTTVEDQGNYTCKMPYYDRGVKYSISRDVRLIVTESPPNEPPKILFPRNHSIEIELGSSVVVDCNASGAEQYHVFWKVNGSYIDSYGKSNVFEIYEKEVLFEGQPFCTVRLNISEVSNQEYEHPFVCHAFNHFGQASAYVKLKDKVPDFRRPLIGLLLTTLILGTATVCIYKVFRVDIVLWYRNSCLTSKVVSDGKIYDAYVLSLTLNKKSCIYCLNNFVMKLLPEILENQCGYKLFIAGRDDLPGQAMISVTDDTIKQSRRLIIILKPELSSCSRLEETSEQQIAIYNALVCYGIKVILIEVEEIQDYTNMPESLKYIKQKYGAIRWKRDFAEKSQSPNTKFWKNVRYLMPPMRSVSHSEFHLLSQVYSNSSTTISR